MRPSPWLSVLLPFLGPLSGPRAVPAQEPAPVAADAVVYGPLGPGPAVREDRLCVRVAAFADVEVRDGVLVSRSGHDLTRLQRLFAGCRIGPAITSVPRALLDEWHERAVLAVPPTRRPGHLGHWLAIEAPSAVAADALLAALQDEPLVEHAYLEPILAGSCASLPGNDPPPPTPSFRSMQTYLDAPPTGLGSRQAQGVLGARGQQVRLRMVETDWTVDHEDISKLVAANFLGAVPTGGTGTANHGLAGTSLLVADRNEWGLTGMVDETDIRFVATSIGVPNALLLAASDCGPGDVLLMVIQFRLGQLGGNDWVPGEYLQLEFDAVATITGNGRIVVCSGANGFRSLDDPRHLRRFDRSFRDSGAIMVAATDGSQLARAPFSNYGSRIDANGWGENVVTAGYGTLFFGNSDPRQSYTAGYSGTSAATPLVCGVVTSLQSAARRQLGRDLTTAEILALLRQHGTAVPGTIGRRPDLLAMFAALGIVDGLLPDEPDVSIGSPVTVRMSGSGGGAVLFASFGTGSTNLGYNRDLHLDPAAMVTVGFFPLVAGQAAWTLPVPNDASLHGANLYLQAAELLAGGGIHVTNSAQVTVL